MNLSLMEAAKNLNQEPQTIVDFLILENPLKEDTYPILEEPDEYKRSIRIILIGKHKQ